MTPTDIKLHQRSGILEISFAEGHTYNLEAEYLRVHSPSAEVQGHSADQKVLQHGKKMVKIANIIAQGNYAIRLVFSDGHDSGIYSWQYLFDLGAEHDIRWTTYLAELKAANKSREPQFIVVG